MSSFTENLYLKRAIQQLQEENEQLQNILNEVMKGFERPRPTREEDIIDGRGANGGRGVGPGAWKAESGVNFGHMLKGSDLIKQFRLPRDPELHLTPDMPMIDGREKAKQMQKKMAERSVKPDKPYASDDMESRRVQPGYGRPEHPGGTDGSDRPLGPPLRRLHSWEKP